MWKVELWAAEVGAAELWAGEVGAAELWAGEVGAAELWAGEVGAAEACNLTMACSPRPRYLTCNSDYWVGLCFSSVPDPDPGA